MGMNMRLSDDIAGRELLSKWHAEKKSIYLFADDGGAICFSLAGKIQISGESFALVSPSGKVIFNFRKIRFKSVATEEILRETKLWREQDESVEIDVGTDARYFLSVAELREGEKVM